MKTPFQFIHGLIFGLIGMYLTSCGLKFEPGPTPEDLETQRRLVLETQLKKDYALLNKTYTPLTYGDMATVKPISFIKLDSLFDVKYRTVQRGEPTDEIDAKIDIQRAVVLRDSSEILYIETHWLQLQQDSLFEYIVGEFALNKLNQLRDMRQIDYFTATPKDVEFAQKYMKESYFVGYAYETTWEELRFYRQMKEKAVSLNGAEKQQFINHVFNLMRIASKDHKLSNENFVIRLSQAAVLKQYPDLKLADLSFDITRIAAQFSPTGIAYTEVIVRKTIEKTGFVIYKYDQYFQTL